MSKKLQNIQDRTAAPPGNWAVTMPETGYRVSSGTYDSLFAVVHRYRRENGLEPWCREVFEDTLCRQLPPNSTNCGLEAVNPHDFEDLRPCLASVDKSKVEWSRVFWGALHRHQLTDEHTDADWLRAFTASLPCPYCANHFQQLQSQFPAPLDDQARWFSWTILVHGEVRKLQGKSVISEEEAQREWLHPA